MRLDFKLLTRSFLIAGLAAFLGGCDLVQETFPESDKEGKLVCVVDGEKFEAAGSRSILAMDFIIAEMERRDDTFLLTVFGVSQYDGGALAVGFKLAGPKLEDIQPGQTLTEWIYNEDIVGNFQGVMGGVEQRASKDSEDTIFKASSNHADEMTFTVTEIDLAAKRISGTFQFKAKDQVTEKLVEVTEGKFSNVHWEEIDTASQ